MPLGAVQAARPAGVETARALIANRASGVSPTAKGFSLSASTANRSFQAEGSKAGALETFKRFEAMVLQTFIQSMLPKDGAAVYGKGVAGDMWKSLLAEKIADSLAERGGIGISDRVLGNHYGRVEKPGFAELAVTPQPGEGEGVAPTELAPALIEDMMRRLRESLVQNLTHSSPTTTSDRG